MLTKWLFFLSLFFLIAGLFVFLNPTGIKQSKVIVFDFGSVIAKSDKQELVKFIAKSLHLSNSEVLEALTQLKQDPQWQNNEQGFWIAYANSKGIKLPDDWITKLNEARAEFITEVPGMINLVKDLQRQGYQTALFSNTQENHAKIKQRLGYYDLFNPIILSYEIGVRKPDPKAYEILLSRLNVPPQAIIFIDNQKANIEAAQAFGMDGIVFSNTDQLIQELKQRGIEISISRPTSDYTPAKLIIKEIN